jgi:exodeoxyribonuclease VII large subunit
MREPIEAPRVWAVGALCRAIADALQAKFNPVRVSGEITGFSRPASGHCYFALKDEAGQIRCAMFRRVASGIDFIPREGDLVEVIGRVGVYEPRGELQLIVEGIKRAGQGTLFEQFLQLKDKLQKEGLFDASRKRSLTPLPRAIGVVTSLGAAALHDVVHSLRRRVPHLPVVLAPASVQGEGAPAELMAALESLYPLCHVGSTSIPVIDVILLVRGGGSIEDLWAFNNEHLARTIARSPVPVVCGVGHETDFTIADFVADLRAPTPTAAAELTCEPVQVWMGVLENYADRFKDAVLGYVDQQSQRLDRASARIGRPLALTSQHQSHLTVMERRMQHALHMAVQVQSSKLQRQQRDLPLAFRRSVERLHDQTRQAEMRLGLLDPSLVLQRGYAWLQDAEGKTISKIEQAQAGMSVRATLADGTVDMLVTEQA